MTLMKISDNGINLIKQYEGCKLFAYRDSVGVATIGYGHTKGVRMGQAITQKQANDFLREDITVAEKVLNNMGINFTQNQFDALCSWIFNLGTGNFIHSTMMKRISAGAGDETITDELIRWHNAGGKPLLGLMRRRVAEANMILGRERYKVTAKNNVYNIIKV